MPKGVFERPAPRGKIRKAAGEDLVPVPIALEEACRNFEEAAGGRQALIEQLAHAPLTNAQELLVGAIADPRNDARSLARICYSFGIQFADIIQLFRAGGFAKAQVEAMRRVWAKLPNVAGDVMDRAVTHTLPCVHCAGSGQTWRYEIPEGGNLKDRVRVDEECETCQGRGEITVQPKLDTQKVALEIGGLLQQKGGGVEVNVLQQAVSAPTTVFGFYKDSDKALYPDAIETESRALVAAPAEEEPEDPGAPEGLSEEP